MSAPAFRQTTTRAQVLDALDDPTLRESFGGWHGVLMHARHLATELAGLDVALAAVDALYLPRRPDHDGRDLDPDLVPIAWSGGRTRPGMHLAVSQAQQRLRDRWTEVAHRYGRLAQAAVDLIASGTELPRWGLPNEPRQDDTDPDAAPPRCALPDPLWDDPQWAEVRWALARVHAAEQALDEYNDTVFVEDPDTGGERFYVPDHLVDAVADLEAAADDRPAGVAEYADAVVHLLATRPDLRSTDGPR